MTPAPLLFLLSAAFTHAQSGAAGKAKAPTQENLDWFDTHLFGTTIAK